jgi:preprotein translocase SecE subunit
VAKKPEAKKKRIRKSAETMRQKVSKTADKPKKIKPIKKVLSKAAKPVKKASSIGKKQYFLIQPREKGIVGWLTKPRKFTPKYFREAYAEIRQVTWPSRRESWKLVFAVIAFAFIFGAAIAMVDFVLDKIFRRAFL